MPTYQYACTACGDELEAVQSFTDSSLTECPVCGGALRKVYSAVGVVFKGSGFYKTDSRASKGSSDGAKPEGGKADKADKADKGEKAAPKTDAMPAAKSDKATSSPSTPGSSNGSSGGSGGSSSNGSSTSSATAVKTG